MLPYFESKRVTYPPSALTLVAIKDKAELEVWAGPPSNPTYIRSYPIRALSGVSGPKLREGDRQVPEGIYEIAGFNPNSRFHLSMKLNYPNAFDLEKANAEGRTQPGSDIFIHGRAVSAGCLAMGDEVIEELFTLVADTGRVRAKVVIAPSDAREAPLSVPDTPDWVAELYQRIGDELENYRRVD